MTFILENRIKELEEIVSILNVRVKNFDLLKKDLEIIIEQKNFYIEKLNNIIEEDVKIIASYRQKMKELINKND